MNDLESVVDIEPLFLVISNVLECSTLNDDLIIFIRGQAFIITEQGC